MIDYIRASAEELQLFAAMYPLQTGPVPRDHDNGIQGQYSTCLGAVLQPAHRTASAAISTAPTGR